MQSDRVEEIWRQFTDDLSRAGSLRDLAEVRDKYLSRQRGLVTLQMRRLASAPKEDRRALGQALNDLRQQVQEALTSRRGELEETEAASGEERLDRTLPEVPAEVGHIHPLRRLAREMAEICVGMGFELLDGK